MKTRFSAQDIGIIKHFYKQGLSFEQIAEKMGCSVKGVKNNINKKIEFKITPKILNEYIKMRKKIKKGGKHYKGLRCPECNSPVILRPVPNIQNVGTGPTYALSSKEHEYFSEYICTKCGLVIGYDKIPRVRRA